MKKRGHSARGNRLAVAMMGTVLALVFAITGATGADAASLQQPCAMSPAGQGQAGTASGGGTVDNPGTAVGGSQTAPGTTSPGAGTAGNAGAEGGQTGGSGQAQICTGEANGGVTTAIGNLACSVVLPEGAAPGATIIVTQPSAGSTSGSAGAAVSPCLVQIINPAGPGNAGAPANAAPGTTGGEVCSITLPGNGTSLAAPTAVAGAGSVAGGLTTTGQGTQPGEAAELPQTCSVVTIDPAPAGGVPAPAFGTATCVVVNGSAAGSGSTAAGSPANGSGPMVVEGGQVQVCPGDVPAGAPSTQPGTVSGTGQAVICNQAGVVNTGAACPTQP